MRGSGQGTQECVTWVCDYFKLTTIGALESQKEFFASFLTAWGASLVAQKVKHLLACRRPGFNPWIGKIPWRRKWQPTPVLLPGKSHGWRNLAGYSPWGRNELDTTERLHFHFQTCCTSGLQNYAPYNWRSVPLINIFPFFPVLSSASAYHTATLSSTSTTI